MTRLYHKTIKDIPRALPIMEHDLLMSTGHNLLNLAARTTCVPYDTFIEEIENYTTAAVLISSGEGVIPGFVESVAAVLKQIGLKAWIVGQSDVAGFGEVLKNDADILFAADDLYFLAIHVRNKTVVDNARSTADGFVQALVAATEMK
ncbi:MAG: hypothetical protein ACFFCW_30905 [Candidatus Hodarchaeota archaeon]